MNWLQKEMHKLNHPDKEITNPTLALIFSKNAIGDYGYASCAVPDGQGGMKTVQYTGIVERGSALERFDWPKEEVVWIGHRNDIKNVTLLRTHNPNLFKEEEPVRRFTSTPGF